MSSDGGWCVGGWGGTLDSGGGSGGAGAVVQNFVPAEDSPITPGTALTFDVVGVDGAVLTALVITVLYPDTGATETCYDRDGFAVNYAATGTFLGSEKQAITGGFHLILRRRGGWPLSPRIKVEGSTGGIISQP